MSLRPGTEGVISRRDWLRREGLAEVGGYLDANYRCETLNMNNFRFFRLQLGKRDFSHYQLGYYQ